MKAFIEIMHFMTGDSNQSKDMLCIACGEQPNTSMTSPNRSSARRSASMTRGESVERHHIGSFDLAVRSGLPLPSKATKSALELFAWTSEIKLANNDGHSSTSRTIWQWIHVTNPSCSAQGRTPLDRTYAIMFNTCLLALFVASSNVMQMTKNVAISWILSDFVQTYSPSSKHPPTIFFLGHLYEGRRMAMMASHSSPQMSKMTFRRNASRARAMSLIIGSIAFRWRHGVTPTRQTAQAAHTHWRWSFEWQQYHQYIIIPNLIK